MQLKLEREEYERANAFKVRQTGLRTILSLDVLAGPSQVHRVAVCGAHVFLPLLLFGTVQKRVEKMEKSGQKWAQEGAGRKKADQDRELENIVRTPH